MPHNSEAQAQYYLAVYQCFINILQHYIDITYSTKVNAYLSSQLNWKLRNNNGDFQDDVCYVVAKYDYAAQGAQELDLRKNERYLLLDDTKHWWRVQNARSQSGYVPSNYVKKEKPSLFDRYLLLYIRKRAFLWELNP